MTKASRTTATADEALRKIGRNVVNFQKMEAMLKVLCSEATFRGPINDLRTSLEKRRNVTSRKTMGQLLKEFLESIDPNSPDLNGFPEDRDSAWMAISLKIDDAEGVVLELREMFEFILGERNKLIHTMLVDFDKESIDSCRALIRDLDAQAEKILPAYENLRAIGKAWSEGRRLLAKQILSENNALKPRDGENDS